MIVSTFNKKYSLLENISVSFFGHQQFTTYPLSNSLNWWKQMHDTAHTHLVTGKPICISEREWAQSYESKIKRMPLPLSPSWRLATNLPRLIYLSNLLFPSLLQRTSTTLIILQAPHPWPAQRQHHQQALDLIMATCCHLPSLQYQSTSAGKNWKHRNYSCDCWEERWGGGIKWTFPRWYVKRRLLQVKMSRFWWHLWSEDFNGELDDINGIY